MKITQDFKSFNSIKNVNILSNIDIDNINESIDFGAITPIKPYQLPIGIFNELNARLGDEYTAHFFYVAAANWCKDKNYKKASTFFDGEAAAELTHAQGLHNYITSWNQIPVISPFSFNKEFKDLVDIVNQAYVMEYELLKKYSDNQQMAISMHPASFNFIQGYVDTQRDEVSEYSDLLNALELININNPLDILYFENKYFK